jgi:hypothetical protein
MIIRFTPDADAELAEARQWYSHQRADLDIEFMLRIDEALSRIVRDPHLYPIVYKTLRRVVVRRFPSLCFMKSQPMRFRSSPFSIRVAILKSGSHELDSTPIYSLVSGESFGVWLVINSLY